MGGSRLKKVVLLHDTTNIISNVKKLEIRSLRL